MPKKTFPVELKDGKHQLYFDDWSFYQFEDVEGRPVTEVTQGSMGIKTLTHLIWAGLLHEYEQEPTIKEVAKLIPIKQFTDLIEVATEAMTDAFGEVDQESAKNTKADPGTGESGSE